MKLSTKALIIAGALFNATCFLFIALMNLLLPPFGGRYLELLSTFYIGYHAEMGPISIFIGLIYALLAGAIEGPLFGWLYNLFVDRG